MLTSSLVLLVAGASGALGSTLDRRAADTNATCSSDFNWLDNTASVSPCRLAAVVTSACHGSTWLVPALTNSNQRYTPPSASLGTLESCSCSWIAYNIFAACAVCQGYPGAVSNWATWSADCGSNIPPTAFPKVPLADGTLIPYYATNDPNNWTDQRFNAAQAQSLVSTGHADVSQTTTTTTTTKKKSTPVGAIVGGVVGGLAAIAIAVGIAFWIHKGGKKKQSTHRSAPSVTSDGMTTLTFGSPPGHLRQLSDTSAKSIGLGYQNLAGSFVTSSATNTRGPMSPVSMHTHTGSVNSLSYFGSVQNSVAPYANSTSPPPQSIPPLPTAHVPGENSQNVITPFTLTPAQQRATSPNSYPADRKRADGAIIPVYDSPDSLPSDLGGGRGGAGSRARMNPPAYSASVNHDHQPMDSISQGAPSRPAHTKKGSADTVTTLASPISPESPISPVTHGTGVNTHISGIDDIIGQLNLQPPPPTVSGTGGTLATGQSMGVNRNQPYRPMNHGAEEPEI